MALLVVAIDLFDCNQRVDNIPQELWMSHFALIQVLKSTGRPPFVDIDDWMFLLAGMSNGIHTC